MQDVSTNDENIVNPSSGEAPAGEIRVTVAFENVPDHRRDDIRIEDGHRIVIDNASIGDASLTTDGGELVVRVEGVGDIVLANLETVPELVEIGQAGHSTLEIILPEAVAAPEAGVEVAHGGGADFAMFDGDATLSGYSVSGAQAPLSSAGGAGLKSRRGAGRHDDDGGNDGDDGNSLARSMREGSSTGPFGEEGAQGQRDGNLIEEANVAPTASDDSFSIGEDGVLRTSLLANDTDGNVRDVLRLTSVESADLEGKLSISADGGIAYDPRGAFDHLQVGEQAVETFRYQISDSRGGISEASVTITIEGRNDAPVATDDNIYLSEDTPLSFTSRWLSGDDRDVDGDTLRVTSVQDAEHGSVRLDADGTITFAPDADFNGEAGFHYTVSDGMGGETTAFVRVHVEAVNDRPVPTTDNIHTAEDSSITFPAGWLSGDDFDVEGDHLEVSAVHHASHGTVRLNPDGTITFTPDADFNGEAGFRYTVKDGNGGFSGGAVRVHVAAVNDAPVATPDGITMIEDTSKTFSACNLSGDDRDVDGDRLSVTAVDGARHGSVTLNPDGTITFTPEAGFTGDASFRYTVEDGNGGSDSASVTVHVLSSNHAPEAINISNTSLREETDGAVVGKLSVVDPDSGDSHTLEVVDDARFHIDAGNNLRLKAGESVDFESEPTIEVTVRATDAAGESTTRTIEIHVLDINHAPESIEISNTNLKEDTFGAVVGRLSATDPDIGDSHTFEVVDDARFRIDPWNRLRLKTGESVDFETEPTIRVTVRATDEDGLSTTRTIKIHVRDFNDTPQFIDISNTNLKEETNGAIVGKLSVVDPDVGDTHTLEVVDDERFRIDNQNRLRLKAGESVDFESEPTIEVTVRATDEGGESITRTIEVQVTDLNDAPVGGGDIILTNRVDGANIVVDKAWLLANDSDSEGDPIDLGDLSTGDSATVSLNGDNVVYNPDGSDFAGGEYLYTISDGISSSDPVNVTIQVIDSDTVTGSAADEILLGTNGGDHLSGKGGDDVLRGFDGDDHIEGGGGRDLLLGNKGADILTGGQGADRLEGGTGNDILSGGLGPDRMNGGGGADRFRIVEADGKIDVIEDFGNGNDALDLSSLLTGIGGGTGADLTGHLRFVFNGTNTNLRIDADGSGELAPAAADARVTFEGVDLTGGLGDQAAIIDQLIASGQLDVTP